MPTGSDATKGAPSKPLARRVVALVKHRSDERTPGVALVEATSIVGRMRARDGDRRSAVEAVQLAIDTGDVMLVGAPTNGERYLTPPTVEAALWSLGDDATAQDARGVAAAEAESDEPQRAIVGAFNRAAAELDETQAGADR